MLKLIGVEIPTTSPAIEPRTVVAALAVGLLVTMVAAIAPAWAATRVAPMEALRNAVPASGRGRARPARRRVGRDRPRARGARRRAPSSGDQRWATLLATVDDVRRAGAWPGRPWRAGMARLADHGRRGGGWRMAARNIARNSRRSAATALALTIGLTVVAAVAVTATSLKDVRLGRP